MARYNCLTYAIANRIHDSSWQVWISFDKCNVHFYNYSKEHDVTLTYVNRRFRNGIPPIVATLLCVLPFTGDTYALDGNYYKQHTKYARRLF